MCTGGGGGGVGKAKINKPSKKRTKKVNKAVNFMADKVDDLLSPDNPLALAQQAQILSGQQLGQVMGMANQVATMAANNQDLLQQDAARLSALTGPPPPEKSASAPVIGRSRSDEPRSGSTRRSLRIDRSQSSPISIY